MDIYKSNVNERDISPNFQVLLKIRILFVVHFSSSISSEQQNLKEINMSVVCQTEIRQGKFL